MHPNPCDCLRCRLSFAFNDWLASKPENSVDQKEVTQWIVEFFGDVLSDMPIYDDIRPMRIIITGELNDDPPRLN